MLTTTKKPRSRSRLVRSLEFSTAKPVSIFKERERQSHALPSHSHKSQSILPHNSQTPNSGSIWRDPLKNVIDPSGFTTHKMSSVNNNFLSSDILSVSSSSEIDEMVGDLIDPDCATLVFSQHDEVFRTSPLSTSSFPETQQEDESIFTIQQEQDEIEGGFNLTRQCNTADYTAAGSLGMTWNTKQNQWLPLIYRYVFPSSAFNIQKQNHHHHQNKNISTSTSWSLQNGHINFDTKKSTRNPSFTFTPPQKSIMMGPHCFHDKDDARDVCEKLLELIDDENLMLPVVKISSQCNSPIMKPNKKTCINANCNLTDTSNSNTVLPQQTQIGKCLLSEWSSLPSSPPPPIFHDVIYNRPIPELRLSPPVSSKSVAKHRPCTLATTATTINSPCESPLSRRLRFSSSSSSVA